MNNLLISLSPHLFWDVDRSAIDPDTHKRYMITRVLSRGTIVDFKALLAYYDAEIIKKEIKEVRSMDDKTANFAAIYLSIPKNEMRCYTWRQSRKKCWSF